MIPRRLTLQGLYSYQQRAEIDFQRLTSAQLFGIFGATGSGKSSILEAISFALYGESERLNKQDNRGYNMMNLKSDRLLIDFIFDTESASYRFAVQGQRHKKRFEQVETLERRAFRQEPSGEWIPIEDKTAESVLGLSYDNFKRTVIIPQGKFQEFLQLTDTERTRMLREIFRLEKYELSDKTAALEQKNLLAQRETDTLLAQLSHATPEAEAARSEQLAAAEEEAARLAQAARQQEQELARQEEIRQLHTRIQAQQAALQTLREQLPAFQAREEALRSYELCLVEFKPLLDRRREDASALERIENTLRQKRELRSQAEQELQKAEDTFRSVSEEYQQRDQYQALAAELETIVRLKAHEQNLESVNERIRKGEQHMAQTRATAEQQREELDAQQTRILELRAQRPDPAQLLALRSWFVQREAFVQTYESRRQALAQVEQQAARLDQDKLAALKPTSLNAAQFALPPAHLGGVLQTHLDELRSRQQGLEQALQDAGTRMQLESFARSLEAGEPCPLCGSVHHPSPMQAGAVAQEMDAARAALKTLREQIQHTETARALLETLDRQLQELGAQQQEQRSSLAEAAAALERHRAAFVWQSYTEADQQRVEDEFSRFQRLEEELQRLSDQRSAVEIARQKELDNLDRYQAALDGLRKTQQDESVAFQAGLRTLRQAAYETHRKLSAAELQKEIAAQQEKRRSIEQLYQSMEERRHKLRSHTDMLRGEISELEKQETELTQRLAALSRRINERLLASGLASAAIAEQILAQQLDVDAEKQAIGRYRQQLDMAEAALRELRAQSVGKQFDEQRYEALRQEAAALQERLTEQTIQAGSLKHDLARLREDLARRASLEQQRDRLRLRGEDLRTLKLLFAKSGFVGYVSTVFLQNLCAAANHRFMKLTRGALSLETTESNTFIVRDYLHNGQTRSVKTLSGGQTFQAALSLALALADQVQQQARSKQNFFFLDEGFGSQDKQSLQVIFDTLKSLRRENRMVGIISHVEELQQEIDTYLYVHNHADSGSRVQGSWEG